MQRYAPTPRQMLWGVLGAFVLMVLLVGITYALTSIPSPSAIATQQSTQLFYSDGKTPLAHLGQTNRTSVPLAQVPLQVRYAVLSAEDRNFEHEPGISVSGILRAMFVDIKGGDVSQGGSTITQQYVKNAYLSQQRTFTRKFKEIFIAVKLGNSKPKAEILQDYLNTIYFGRNAYGIEAAAKAYFNRDVAHLTVAQGAVLAAVIRAPSFYDPAVNPAAALKRWHYVIDGMVKQHWLASDEASRLQFPTTAHVSTSSTTGDCVGSTFFICQAVKAELQRNGFGEDRLAAGGYRVVTTIDRTAQRGAADAMAANGGQGHFKTSGADRGREAALVSVQPGDGAIRAMYGGSDGCAHQRADSCTDLTGVGSNYTRSPGSSFKPYTVIAALQDGIGLDSRFPGPAHIDFPGTGGKGISNSQNESCGTCSLTEALAKSINTIFVPLAQRVGPDKVAHVAEDAGIPTRRIRDQDLVPTLTLGVADVAPVDQAVGYATIAAQGVYARPYLVAAVKTHDGRTVYKAQRETKRVFPADVMADTTFAMTKVLDCSFGGTACGNSLPNRPAAGKTGTNGQGADNFDAWFVGFTPQLSTAVWYGNTDHNKPVTTGGTPMYGGGIPAATWQQMMSTALANKPVLPFPPPAHVGAAQNSSPSSSSSPTASASPSTTPSPSVSVTVTPTLTPTVGPSHTLPPVTPTPSGTATGAAGGSPQPTGSPGG